MAAFLRVLLTLSCQPIRRDRFNASDTHLDHSCRISCPLQSHLIRGSRIFADRDDLSIVDKNLDNRSIHPQLNRRHATRIRMKHQRLATRAQCRLAVMRCVCKRRDCLSRQRQPQTPGTLTVFHAQAHIAGTIADARHPVIARPSVTLPPRATQAVQLRTVESHMLVFDWFMSTRQKKPNNVLARLEQDMTDSFRTLVDVLRKHVEVKEVA